MRDANGQSLAYVYCRESDDAASIAKVLTEADSEQHRQAAKLTRQGARNLEPTKPRVREEEDPVESPQASREARSN